MVGPGTGVRVYLAMNIRPGIPRPSDHPFQPHPTRLI